MNRLSFKIAICIGFILSMRPLYAQTETDIERATREADRLGGKEKIEEKLRRIPEEPSQERPEQAPPKEKEQKFLIKKIELVGCESFTPQAFSPIIEEYENKQLSLSDLDGLAKEIERMYLRLGVIAAVFVPPQEIKEKTVVLQVVEARMGELGIQEDEYFKKERLNYYWKIPQGEILHYDKLSRSIQLMNKNPDRQVKGALHAGKKLGTTDVSLSSQTRLPLHFISSFDREGAVATGRSRLSYGMRHNNFLGLDDTFITSYTSGRDFSGIYTYHSLPITSDGASLLYGYSQNKSIPTKEFKANELKSKTKNTTLSLHQDLYRGDKYLGEVFLGFDAKDKTTWINTGVFNRDRLRIFNIGGNFVRRDFGSNTYTSLEFSQGADAFGASSKGNPLASRQAKSNFSRLNLGLQHKRILPLNLQANVKFKTQVAYTKLTPQEEFSLGGIDSVRGYPAGDYLADNAVSNNLELLIPGFFIPKTWRLPYEQDVLREQTTALIFVDYGWGRRRGALPTEAASVSFLSVGTGVRLNLFNQALLRLEWGYPLPSNRPITEKGLSRIHFSLDFQDKLPEELERIRKLIEEENIKQWSLKLVDEELLRFENPLSIKLYDYLYLAQAYYEQKKLAESKMFYEKILDLGRALYRQSEDYVRSCVRQEEELKEYQRLARADYEMGKLNEAKELWQKIIDEAGPKPLIFEF